MDNRTNILSIYPSISVNKSVHMIDSLWKAFSNQNGFENIVNIMFLCFNGIAFITIKCWMLQHI